MSDQDDQDRLADTIRRLTDNLVASEAEVTRLTQENARLKAVVEPFTVCSWEGSNYRPLPCGECVACQLKAVIAAPSAEEGTN